MSSRTGLSPTPVDHPRPLPLTQQCAPVPGRTPQPHPTTPHTQPLPGITRTRFSLIRYRSPLHTESQLFSSPTGTEMFHFPASTPTQTMHSSAGNTTQPVLGFPIRTSSDQRFVGNSPRHNAASHVLHRLSMPRHPPYALNNQTHYPTHTTHTTHHTKKQAACADTQNTYKRSCKHKTLAKHKKIQPTPHQNNGAWKEERCSRPLYSSHTTHPHHNNHTPTKMRNHSRAGQQDNHNHTLTARGLLCAAPDTQQHANTLKNNVCETVTTQVCYAAHLVLRMRIHPDFKNTFRWQSHTRRLNHHTSHNRGHKTKAP